MTPLRAALVGVGRIADMHYIGYSATPKAELAALCDVDPDLLSRRAAKWGVEKTYNRLRRPPERPRRGRGGHHHAALPPCAHDHRRAGSGKARHRAEADGPLDCRGRRHDRGLRARGQAPPRDRQLPLPPTVRSRQADTRVGRHRRAHVHTHQDRQRDGSRRLGDSPSVPCVALRPDAVGRRLGPVRPRPPRLDDSPLPARRHRACLRLHRAAPRWSSTTRSCRAASSTIRA